MFEGLGIGGLERVWSVGEGGFYVDEIFGFFFIVVSLNFCVKII